MLIYRGAEAELYREKFLGMDCVRKTRLPKTFKQRELDERLRRERVKTEARMLQKARSAVNTPHVYSVQGDTIIMEYVDGQKAKDLFLAKDTKAATAIGTAIRKLHDAGIIHNDLTTSNLILKDGTVWFIDFGLAVQGSSLEDKAVDLLVFKRMLSSTHYDVFDKVWPEVLKGYKADKAMLKKMAQVESRAKYKTKGGF